MKRLLLALCILTVALVAAAFGVTGTALAEDVVRQQFVTDHYIDFGEICAISSYRNSAAVLRTKDGEVYLTVMGDVEADVCLSADAYLAQHVQISADEIGEHTLALYDHYVLMVVGDKLRAYDCSEDVWRDTNVPTTLVSYDGWSEEPTYTPLTQFCVDERGKVFVCYGLTTLRWLAFDDIFLAAKPTVTSTYLAQPTQAFVAHSGVCYFYSTAGKMFTVDTTGESPVTSDFTDVAALTDFDFADRLLFLRGGVVEVREAQATTLLAKYNGTASSDSLLRNATALSTSFDGTEWRIWVVDNGQSAVKVYDASGAFLTMYGTWGVDDGRLNAPTAVALDSVFAVIRDDGNARTVVVDLATGTYTHEVGLAASIATVGGKVYIAEEDVVTCYDYARPDSPLVPYTKTVYYLPADVLSVCTDGATIYALTADCLYVLRSTDDPVAQIYVHAVAAKVGRQMGIVYIQTDNAITVFKDLVEVGVSVDITDIDVADFDVDFCGNVYVLTVEGALHVFLRTETGYEHSTIALSAPLRALSITAEGMVYGLSQSALVALDLPVRTRENSAYPAPEWDLPVSVVEVVDTVWGYASPNNYESVVRVPAGTYAMRMADHTYQGVDYCYIEFALSTVGNVRYERVFVPREAAVEIAYSEPTEMYVRYDGATETTGVYPYPSYSATATMTVSKADATFKVLRLMGVKEGTLVWGWYMVELADGLAGYVAADNYVAAELPYKEVERYYARCVAGKLGEKVTVYASPDEGSEVVATLVDGTKVELTAPFDADREFTCIRLDDREVYIRTANVTTRPLTSGQSFALILGIVVICAAAVTLVLYLLVKKRR